jgi:hypothetical protein
MLPQISRWHTNCSQHLRPLESSGLHWGTTYNAWRTSYGLFRCIHEQSRDKRPYQVMGRQYGRLAIWNEWKHRHREESKTLKRRQCSNQQGVGHESRFSKDNWEHFYFMIFSKSWNWPSCSSECLQYVLCWHLVVEASSFTVKQPLSTLWYIRICILRHVGTLH